MNGEPVELCGANLKFKYRGPKPKGRYRSDYNGNQGKHRHKGVLMPVVGTGRKETKVRTVRRHHR